MTDNDKASFEPFITVSLAQTRQAYQSYLTTRIAIGSNAPGVTVIHTYDVPDARCLVDEINKLIAVLDPPASLELNAELLPSEKRRAKRKRPPTRNRKKASR